MQTIYLRDANRPITISESAFSLIEELAHQNAICQICEKSYDEDRPEVAQNLCLLCFVEKYRDKQLSFLMATEPDTNGERQFLFIGEKGYIFPTFPGLQREPEPDSTETLMQWGFSPPSQVTIGTKTTFLTRFGWSIYGDFRVNSVVVLERRINYMDMQFLAYKHGESIYLDRQKGATRTLYLKAKKQLEASKDSDDRYHYNTLWSYHLHGEILYTLIADRASAEYDTSQKERS